MPFKKGKTAAKPAAEAAKEAETASKESAALSLMDVQIVKPMVTADQALAAWRAYQQLKKNLLDGSDYQSIKMFQQGRGMVERSFVKKSGWRKLATAFNISVEISKEERKEYHVDKPNYYFVIEVTAKAIAMNGRHMVGTGSCASNERGFAHLEHDVRTTAETRAKNRAISDLIGGGEVSAEEVMQQKEDKQNSCANNHDELPEQAVKNKESKNFGRSYVTCELCKYWKWTDKPKAKEDEQDLADVPQSV